MTQRRGSNIAASMRQRLLNKARETKRPFSEMLQYFAMERFLYRSSKSAHADKFVLKGALMFTAWQAPVTRPTMDIDLLGITDNNVDAIVAVARNICNQEVEADGLVFDSNTIVAERIMADADYGGVRVRFRGTLGTARVTMQLDIGFGDVVVPKPKMTNYPAILNLPRPRLRGYSRESAVAEKFEAMVKLGVLNSRVKDFFDIWLLSRQFDFDGETMTLAIDRTFSTRGTAIRGEPIALTDDFAKEASRKTQWQGFVRKNRLQDTPASFADIVEAIAVFLGPIARALAASEGFQGLWEAPGPWRKSTGR